MALKEIAVSGMTLSIVEGLPTPVLGTIIIVGTPSVKNIAGSGMYKHGLAIQVTAITSPAGGATILDPGPKPSNFIATALKVKADGILVLRKDDKTGIISAIPQIPGSPPVAYPVTFKVKVTIAGQIKVTAE